jgi:hypothetical protein
MNHLLVVAMDSLLTLSCYRRCLLLLQTLLLPQPRALLLISVVAAAAGRPHPEVQQCIAQLLQLSHATKILTAAQHCQHATHALILLGGVQHLGQQQQQEAGSITW